jgi:hypothetical protein
VYTYIQNSKFRKSLTSFYERMEYVFHSFLSYFSIATLDYLHDRLSWSIFLLSFITLLDTYTSSHTWIWQVVAGFTNFFSLKRPKRHVTEAIFEGTGLVLQ